MFDDAYFSLDWSQARGKSPNTYLIFHCEMWHDNPDIRLISVTLEKCMKHQCDLICGAGMHPPSPPTIPKVHLACSKTCLSLVFDLICREAVLINFVGLLNIFTSLSLHFIDGLNHTIQVCT